MLNFTLNEAIEFNLEYWTGVYMSIYISTGPDVKIDI